MTKATVYYTRIAFGPEVGQPAVVECEDHPGVRRVYHTDPGPGEKAIAYHTSDVVAVHGNGVFETRNTRYVPIESWTVALP